MRSAHSDVNEPLGIEDIEQLMHLFLDRCAHDASTEEIL